MTASQRNGWLKPAQWLIKPTTRTEMRAIFNIREPLQSIPRKVIELAPKRYVPAPEYKVTYVFERSEREKEAERMVKIRAEIRSRREEDEEKKRQALASTPMHFAYHPDFEARLVTTDEYNKLIESGWYDTPAKFPCGHS